MNDATMEDLGRRAKVASRVLAGASTASKDAALLAGAELLEARAEEILSVNSGDVERSRASGVAGALLDRLRLDERRISAMAAGMRTVAALPDPVGEVVGGWVRPNGLEIRQVRVPLGVVGIIYESRPNVTSDAASLCLKSGNTAFLRGSSAAIGSNKAIVSLLREAYAKCGLPEDGVILVEDTSREAAKRFMQLNGVIDCLIPRGGASLIASVLESASVPYVIDGDGNCHVYIDSSADLDMATGIVVNAKTQRPGVCNAAESLVVHRDLVASFLPLLADQIAGVELRGDQETRAILGSRVMPAGPDDYRREFLDLILSIRVVGSLDEAIGHITEYSSGHTEAIVTSDLASASRFQKEVDAAVVVVNASTRFTDGEEFGFGAEIGISTQKLHARGPMGLRELTTTKYLVSGSGQIRG